MKSSGVSNAKGAGSRWNYYYCKICEEILTSCKHVTEKFEVKA